MRAKIYITVFVAAVALSGCFGRKALDAPEQERIGPVDNNISAPDYGDIVPPADNGSVAITLTYTGVVRDMSKHEGCGFMIELDAGNGEKLYLEPLTLDEKYKVDGKTIQFQYTDSRRPSQCTMPSKPIVIDKIIE